MARPRRRPAPRRACRFRKSARGTVALGRTQGIARDAPLSGRLSWLRKHLPRAAESSERSGSAATGEAKLGCIVGTALNQCRQFPQFGGKGGPQPNTQNSIIARSTAGPICCPSRWPDVAFWHECELPTALSNVRVRGQSGKHMLAPSSTRMRHQAHRVSSPSPINVPC